jgi:hypothetical protein
MEMGERMILYPNSHREAVYAPDSKMGERRTLSRVPFVPRRSFNQIKSSTQIIEQLALDWYCNLSHLSVFHPKSEWGLLTANPLPQR